MVRVLVGRIQIKVIGVFDMLIEINNNFDGWRKAKNDVETAIKNQVPDNIDIRVKVSANDEDDGDVLTLQYYFPIVDVARDSRKITTLDIIIEDADDEVVKKKIIKIAQYLYVQNATRQGIKITINGETLGIQTRYGRLIPVICVNDNSDDRFFYKKITNIFDDKKTMQLVFDFCREYVNNGTKGSYVFESEEFEALIDECDFVYNNIKVPFEKKDTHILEKLFFISDIDDVYTIYVKMFLSNMMYILTNIKGTLEDPIIRDFKSDIITQVELFYKEKCEQLPIISVYIWSLLVRCAFDKKNIVNLECTEKHVFRSILEKFLIDAMSYTDGLYQIIENSCMHSESKCVSLSLRLYDTDVDNISSSMLVHNAHTIDKLSRTYNKITDINDAKMYIEMTILDNAFNKESHESRGMIWTYNNANEESKHVHTIKELFTRVPQNKSDVLLHYGLRTFERIVLLNKGCLIVDTPDTKKRYVAYNRGGKFIRDDLEPQIDKDKKNTEEDKRNESEQPQYNITSYKILIPVYPSFSPSVSNSESYPKCVFETDLILSDYKQVYVDLDNVFLQEPTYSKNDIIDKIYKEIETKIVSKKDDIMCICTNKYSYHHIELMARSVMKYAIENKNRKNRIAIFFENKTFINEFVRVFTVFFDKTGKNFKDFKVENTQIALCSIRDGIPEVNFILCGSNLVSARKNASIYSYYNSEASIEFLHLVEHMSRCEESNQNFIFKPLFPFDLALKNDDFNIKNGFCSEGENWFVRRINSVLNTDLQKTDYGCKIEGINVSIGSKIHIDTFYNAELLFHNYGNVSRFAYLIAKQIITEDDFEKKILLIGYEDYSSLLIQEIKTILEGCDPTRNKKIDTIIFDSEFDETDIEKYGGFWPKFKNFININDIKEYTSYIILPIATTLTTIYKIKNIMKRICSYRLDFNEPRFGVNTALIVVGGTHAASETDELPQGVEFGYWKDVDKIGEKITINDKNENGTIDEITKYYFSPTSKWEKAIKFDEDKIADCLIGVDKTNTLPNVIFESFSSNKKFFNVNENNDERINRFLGKISYSHICDFDNHFQFSIDYEKYCQEIEVDKKDDEYNDIEKWLLTELRPNIDDNAFNIIVTPLSVSNSLFLKNVINCAFDNSVRVFNVNINNSYREEIRAKYNYITLEYCKMRNMMPNPTINVYYVDTCIVSGTTLQRGKQLISMLLPVEEQKNQKVNIYKGIILLTNRSSYETINNLTANATENCFSYVRLNVPSYNTRNGICPSCSLSEQYKLMHRRASTHKIADEYQRLHLKHSCRDKLSYNTWLDVTIKERTSYIRRFLQWVYYHGLNNQNNNGEYYDILGRVQKVNDVKNLWDIISKLKSNSFTIDVLNDEEQGTFSQLVKDYIVSEHDFLRTICTHRVFSSLENVMCDVDSEKVAEAKTRKIILKLFSDALKEIQKMNYPDETKCWYICEWIISYIKVISRKQVAKYYHIRNAMYHILLELAEGILNSNKSVKKDIEFLVEICRITEKDRLFVNLSPEMKLNIFLTIVRRLSALHSLFVINNIDSICEFYYDCNKQYDGAGDYTYFYKSTAKLYEYKEFVTIIPSKDFCFNIAKLVKWSAMSDYDESKCFAIEERFKGELEGANAPANIKKLSYLENTQVIFSGIRRLSENFVNINSKELLFFQIEKEIALSKTDNGDYLEISLLKLFFKFMDKRSHNLINYENKVIDTYTNMCMYFKTLKEICERKTALDSPYYYENLCNYMRDILAFDECLIVCEDNNSINTIASSNTDIRYFNKQIPQKIIDELVAAYANNIRTGDNLINSIVQGMKMKNSVTNEECGEAILINIPISQVDKPQLNIYLLFYKYRDKEDSFPFELDFEAFVSNFGEDDKELSVKDFWNVRNILFLRDRLEFVFGRDIIFLQNLYKSRNYVEPIDKNKSIVMHISDIHINVNNGDNIIKEIRNAEFSVIPDLLVITGDVVQGAYSAISFWDNYVKAIEVIRALATKLWGYEVTDSFGTRKFIRSDWKKRIIISSGNHDYASMNDLIAENKKRKTLSGKPINEPSTTLIRHSYFIIFLHELLGWEIDDVANNDINQLINYDKLGVTVLNINTNSGVNPYRTNKVKINKSAVDEIFKTTHTQNQLICMMHHTPLYDINYINDVYYLRCKLTIQNKVLDSILKTNKDLTIEDVWLGLLNSMAYNFEKNYMGLGKQEQENIMLVLLQEIEKVDSKFYLENSLADFVYYLKTTEEERPSDDRCSYLISSLKEQLNSSSADKESYIDFSQNFFSKIAQKYIILGGHVHCERKYIGPFDGALAKCRGIYEVGRFFDNSKNYNYILIEIANNDSRVTYLPTKSLQEEWEPPIVKKLIKEKANEDRREST